VGTATRPSHLVLAVVVAIVLLVLLLVQFLGGGELLVAKLLLHLPVPAGQQYGIGSGRW